MVLLARLTAAMLLLLLGAVSALAAGCFAAIADTRPGIIPAALRLAEASEVDLTFLGHASFLIESPGGVRSPITTATTAPVWCRIS